MLVIIAARFSQYQACRLARGVRTCVLIQHQAEQLILRISLFLQFPVPCSTQPFLQLVIASE